MARPFWDRNAGKYAIKVKNPTTGKWGKEHFHKPASPPTDPHDIPPHILELAEKYRKERQPAVQILNAEPTIIPPNLPAMPYASQAFRLIDLEQRLNRFVEAQCRTLRPKSREKLLWIAERFRRYIRHDGIRHLHEVRAATIKDFVEEEITLRDCKEQTMKAQLSLLGKMFSQAIRLEEYHGQNPIRAVCHDLQGTDTTDKPKYFNVEERAAFLAEIKRRVSRPEGARGKLPQWVEDAVLIMLNTGIRVGAVRCMEFSWVDLGQPGKITIPKNFSKSRKAYATMLNPTVREIVNRRRTELGPQESRLFPELKNSANLYFRLKWVVRGLMKSGKFQEDKGHYNHILRHTFITEALNAKIPLVHVSKMAGHTSVAMTQRYDHTTYEDAIAAGLEVGFSL